MEGDGVVIGKRAPNFSLPDQNGGTFTLYGELTKGPYLLAFYPGDFTKVCTKQLCNYRDHLSEFRDLGVNIAGISHNPAFEHSRFAKKFEFDFRLLTDNEHKVARQFECTSFLMLGRISRAVFILNTSGVILYRYVEPTVLTHRSSDELIGIVKDLRANNLL